MRVLIITIMIGLVCTDQSGYNYQPMSYSGIGLFHTPDAGIRKTFYVPENTYIIPAHAAPSKSSSSYIVPSYNKPYQPITPNVASAHSETSYTEPFYTEPTHSSPLHQASAYYLPSYATPSNPRPSYSAQSQSTALSSSAYSTANAASAHSEMAYSAPSIYTENPQASLSNRAPSYYLPSSYATPVSPRPPSYSTHSQSTLQSASAYSTHANPRPFYATPWKSPNSGTPSYSPSYIPAPPAALRKEFYTFSAPESEFDDSYAMQNLANRVKQAVRVVFIKGPENKAFEDAALTLAQQAAQQHTAIYVLNKQPDIADLANTFNAIGKNANNKPDVHFVKYRTPEDAAHAQKEIQHQYDLLEGDSERIDDGVARVINFASQPSVDTHSGQQIQSPYLPSSSSSVHQFRQ